MTVHRHHRMATGIAVVILLLAAQLNFAAAAELRLSKQLIANGGGASHAGTLSLRCAVGEPILGESETADTGLELCAGYLACGVKLPTPTPPDGPSALPKVLQLHPARPNPFNPSTELAFDLPAPGRVRVAVYDLRGQLLRVLTDQPYAAGRYRLRWNGRDDQGARVASGVYFARLVTAGGVRSWRMALVK